MKKVLVFFTNFVYLGLFLTLPNLVFAGPTDALNSPGGNYPSLGDLITTVLPWVFGLIAFLAVVVFAIGALRYMLSNGDPKAASGARGTMTGAVIGLIIVLGSAALSGVFDKVFGLGFFGTNARTPNIGNNGGVNLDCAFLLTSLKCNGEQFSSFGTLVTFILSLLLSIGGVIFFFMLIWGGIRYMTARGDEKAVTAARDTLTNSFVGLLLIISSLVIIRLITTLLFQGFTF